MEKEEKINMCQAMEEWYADAVREGMAKGLKMDADRKKALLL